MNISNMKAAEWTMAVGTVFGIGLFVVTFITKDPWRDDAYRHAPPIRLGAPLPHADARARMVCAACHEMIWSTGTAKAGTAPPIPRWRSAPHTDGREKRVCATCHRILSASEAAVPGFAKQPGVTPVAMQRGTLFNGIHYGQKRFQGRVVQRVEENPAIGRSQVSIRVNDGMNPSRWIQLAPLSHLEAGKCRVPLGSFAKGTAFVEATPGRRPGVWFARTLASGGERCTLRDRRMQLRPMGDDHDG
ncbi:MAG: magnetochrome domain-containing protein [Magnetococcales bacterium]|nr:magnetochrome domain-containing protein [Magnetococcales bacterium]